MRGRRVAYSDEQRFAEFVRSVKASGGMIEEQYVISLDDTAAAAFSAGADGCRHLLSLLEPPTVIFAYNDSMAMGCLLAASQAGFAVPVRLSVVGHNDLPFAPYTIPPLSTISISRSTLGDAAVQQLLALMSGGQASVSEVGSYFRNRGSIAPPRPMLPD